MKRVQWTVGAARTQSILHFLIAPLMLWVGLFARHVTCPFFSYASSHQLGLFLGVLLCLLVAFVAWGLWNRRAWARQLAMVFHGVTAIAALYLSIAWTYPYLASSGNECGVTKLGIFALAIGGGIAFGLFILSSGFLW